jgi:hypothetical protein
MNCFHHDTTVALGVCTVCQKGVCRQCVWRDSPRLVCATCARERAVIGYEYRSRAAVGGWPLVHICVGMDPATLRPRVAKGIVAIGHIAVGLVAIAGVACGLLTVGGVSVGLLFALGGAAVGLGMSVGGVALGTIAIGGVAVGFAYAIGGAAAGTWVLSGARCDQEAADLIRAWLGQGSVPPTCR